MEGIKDLKFVDFSGQYASDLCQLYAEVFNKKVDKNYFVLKYGLDIDPARQMSSVALIHDKVIGFMGVLVQKFIRGQQSFFLAQGCDYILLKEYRGQSVFQAVYHYTLDKAKESNIFGLYAFQSEQTYKVSKKLGWKDEVGFSRFHIKVFPFSTSRIVRWMGFDAWRQQSLENRLKPFLSKLNIDDLKSGKKFEQEYDEVFFQKKSFCKHFLIEISGCILYLKYNHLLSIGFCHLARHSDLPEVVHTLRNICRLSLIHNVVFHVQSNSLEANQLAQYLTEFASYKVSSWSLDPRFSMSEIKLNFMDMDIF